MIKDNQRHFNRLHVLIDACIIAVSYMLAWWVQFQLLNNTSGLVFRHYMSILPLLVPLYVVIYALFGLYTTKSVRRKRVEVEKIVQANTIGLVLFMTALFFFRGNLEFTNHFSRMLLAWFYLINITLECLFRNFIRLALQHIREKGFNQKHMILVGYSRAAEEYICLLYTSPKAAPSDRPQGTFFRCNWVSRQIPYYLLSYITAQGS